MTSSADEPIPEVVKDLLEELPVPIHFFGSDDSLVWLNRSMKDLLRCEDGELNGLATTEIFDGYEKEKHSQLVESFIDLGFAKGTVEVIARDGERTEVAFTSVANVFPGIHMTLLIPPVGPVLMRDHHEWPSTPLNKPFRLTDREFDVLVLVADGAGNGLIAGALGIAETTVQQHLDSCRSKLGASSRGELVSRAIALGCIQPKPSGQVLLVLESAETPEVEARIAKVTYVSPSAAAARPPIGRLAGSSIAIGAPPNAASATSGSTDAPPGSGIEYSEGGELVLSGLLADAVGPKSEAKETPLINGYSLLSIEMHDRRKG